jgi:hypothetical protein
MSNTGGKGKNYYPMILVEQSVGSKQLYEPIKEIANTRAPKAIVVKKQFKAGDIKWEAHGKKYCVEYKKLEDVLSCMIDGRFVSQLRRMQEEFDYYWLLIGNEFKATDDGAIKYRKVWGKSQGGRRRGSRPGGGVYSGHWFEPFNHGGRANNLTYYGLIGWLTTMELPAGCGLWVVPDDQQAAHWIMGKYLWAVREWDKHKSLNVFDTSQRPSSRDKRGVKFIGTPNEIARVAYGLMGRSGIGWEKARALSRHFTSVETFMTASEGELRKVKGIGKELASRIIEKRSRVINKADKPTTKKTLSKTLSKTLKVK